MDPVPPTRSPCNSETNSEPSHMCDIHCLGMSISLYMPNLRLKLSLYAQDIREGAGHAAPQIPPQNHCEAMRAQIGLGCRRALGPGHCCALCRELRLSQGAVIPAVIPLQHT